MIIIFTIYYNSKNDLYTAINLFKHMFAPSLMEITDKKNDIKEFYNFSTLDAKENHCDTLCYYKDDLNKSEIKKIKDTMLLYNSFTKFKIDSIHAKIW